MPNYPEILRILGFQIAPHLVGNKHHPWRPKSSLPPMTHTVDGLEIRSPNPLRLVVEIPLFTRFCTSQVVGLRISEPSKVGQPNLLPTTGADGLWGAQTLPRPATQWTATTPVSASWHRHIPMEILCHLKGWCFFFTAGKPKDVNILEYIEYQIENTQQLSTFHGEFSNRDGVIPHSIRIWCPKGAFTRQRV